MSYLYQRSRSYILFVVIVCAIIISGFTGVHSASAQAVGIPGTIELNGYAWSETIGWISLNCKTGGVNAQSICPGSPGGGPKSDYKVSLGVGGNLTGYAWSSNIGWIRFGGLTGFPSPASSGNNAVSARMTGTYPNLTFDGWIRACAGTQTGTCSTMNPRPDGWDGWISLRSSAAPAYSIQTQLTGLRTNSYAWGSTNVGWIDMFTRVTWDAPSATLTGVSCTIPRGQNDCQGALSWVMNPTPIASPTIYRLSPNPNTLSTLQTGTNIATTLEYGANVFVARTGSTELDRLPLTIGCASGQLLNAGICPNEPPTLVISTARPMVRIGETVRVDWTITGLLDGSCTLSGPGLSGTTVTTTGFDDSSAINNFTTFGITCTGSYGTVTVTDTVEVVPSTQEI